MDYYWEIVEHDGTSTMIPPEANEVVKRRWDEGQAIHTTGYSIPANQIKKFHVTDKPYGQQPLLEAAAQAFGDAMYNADGSVVGRWVKKQVPQQQYNKHHSHIPSYKNLGDNGHMVTVAFFLPVHIIDLQKVSYCTAEEEAQLEKMKRSSAG